MKKLDCAYACVWVCIHCNSGWDLYLNVHAYIKHAHFRSIPRTIMIICTCTKLAESLHACLCNCCHWGTRILSWCQKWCLTWTQHVRHTPKSCTCTSGSLLQSRSLFFSCPHTQAGPKAITVLLVSQAHNDVPGIPVTPWAFVPSPQDAQHQVWYPSVIF